MKFRVAVEVEAPEGATHFSGEILDDPTWYKFAVNSTGVIRAWYWYCPERGWMYHREGTPEEPPHWVKPIEPIRLKP